MKFAIITHVQHIKNDNFYFGYAPYIREMNIWLQHVDDVIVVAPLVDKELNPIHEQYRHSNLGFRTVPEFNITSVSNVFKALFKLPKVFSTVYSAMYQADHIHLRCPGNMGLVGALVQILFPNKQKTVKYAGNWDPKSKQPWSYKLQKGLLSNTFLTRNMQVLVYGEWPNQTRNIKPFFTATYSEKDTQKAIIQRDLSSEIQFLFVGTLSKGKRPLYAVQLVEALVKKGYNAKLAILGEGKEREKIGDYCKFNQLNDYVTLHGNQELSFVKELYTTSHFLILPSKSEGWPKVVAEAMFWGCVPIATAVSCVPFMLGNGKRGVVLSLDEKQDQQKIVNVLNNPEQYQRISNDASDWSRQYTTDYFEREIAKLVKQ